MRKHVIWLITIYSIIAFFAAGLMIWQWTENGLDYLQGKGGLLEEKKDIKHGWVFEEDQWRYYLNTGEWMRSCWIPYKNEWYYIGDDGFMVTGWQVIEGDKYFFSQNGAMVKGQSIEMGNYTYHFNDVGQCDSRERNGE